MASQPSRTRPGFTLVEMLVVITIIGVLMALLIPVIAGVVRRTRASTIAIEIKDIASAIEAYKSKHKDYFPDFTNQVAVVNHVRKVYPRNTRDVAGWLNPSSPLPTQDPRTLDAAEALVFWLSSLSSNVKDPLSSTGERAVFYKFDDTRLKDRDGDGWMEFYLKHGPDCPLVYFDGRLITVPNATPVPAGQPASIPTYSYAWAVYPSPYSPATPQPKVSQLTRNYAPPPAPTSDVGVVRPYRSNTPIDTKDNFRTWPYGATNPTQWMNPETFQLFSAGLDNLFGVDTGASFKTYPTPNYQVAGVEEEDNITSFSDNRTLGDSVP